MHADGWLLKDRLVNEMETAPQMDILSLPISFSCTYALQPKAIVRGFHFISDSQ